MAISTPTTPGQILTSAYVNNNINSGMVYVKSQTVGASQTSFTVTNAFSAEYDNYKVIYSGGTASASVGINLQLSGITTGYYGAAISASYGGGSPSVDGYNNVAHFPAGKGNTGSMAYCFMDVDILAPFLSSIKVCFGPFMGGNVAFGSFSARTTTTTSCTGFTVNIDGGSVSGGTITVYGYRKA